MSPAQLQDLRQQISKNSVDILDLLNRRAELALKILAEKRRLDLPVFDPEREEQLLAEIVGHNQGPLPDAVIAELFRKIIETSRELQQQQQIKP